MSHDLFSGGVHESGPRARQSSLVFVSAMAHAGIIAALVVASMLLPGIVPAPRASMIWDGPRLVRIADIRLPPQRSPSTPARRSSTADPPGRTDTPVVAPDGVRNEATQPPELPLPGGGPDSIGSGAMIGDVTGHTLQLPPPPPPSEPAAPRRLHSGIEPPHKVRDVTPVYPAAARAAGAHGVVIIEATIDARGDVVAARVLRSVPMLDDAAIDAVRQWKYTPARLNAEAVAVLITVTVNFTLAAR